MIELNADIIKESIEMTQQGASHKDLHTNLFVPKEDFNSWFLRGRDLVDEGYGRVAIDIESADSSKDLNGFDVMCLLLYRGIIQERWKVKKSMYALVSKSAKPELAFKFMEALYRTEYNPRYAESEEDDIGREEDESATSFAMGEFFGSAKTYPDYSDTDETVDETQESETS